MKDQLTGVNPDSNEGKLVVNSVALRQHFAGQTGKIAGPVKIQVDPQAPIYWAYKQAYNTHYNEWMKKGVSEAQARSYARSAAMEFAVARKKASWMPGSKEGLDASLKDVQIPGAPDSGPSSPSDSDSGEFKFSDFALNYQVIGDPSRKSSQSQVPGQEYSSKQPEKAPAPKPETKSETPKLAPASSPTITPSTKPNIPPPPSKEPTIAALPIPSKSSTPQTSGVSNQGTKSLDLFRSYKPEEPTLAVVASIYNMWGGL
jgi:hypothetical protein